MTINTTHQIFIEPLDVLYLRGNKLFGGAGDHGESLMPPWPSMAAGALRSRLMADGASLASLAEFKLTRFGLARQTKQGETETETKTEALWPLPADLIVTEDDLSNASYLRPTAAPTGIGSSHALPYLPALRASKPGKPVSGLWLSSAGIAAWLAGRPILAEHLIRSSKLWRVDPRLGIALDSATGSAADGKIYTTDTVALCDGVGFVAVSAGHESLTKNCSKSCLVRLGGDGRAARVSEVSAPLPVTDWERIEREQRFRLILTTPGIFSAGWQPEGIPATLLAASVSRAETVSGWDLVTKKPKPAQRIAPTGSVYWYGKLTDLNVLKALADNGLSITDPLRRAEGFNHCFIAPWQAE